MGTSVPWGREITCKGWRQEALLRMLMNTVDPFLEGRPPGQTFASWRTAQTSEIYGAIIAALRELEDDETLLVRDGELSGVFPTSHGAPRVVIVLGRGGDEDGTRREQRQDGDDSANSANGQSCGRIGLVAHGQLAAESWMYTGRQEILLGTYTVFAAAQRLDGDLRLVLSGGFGRMGGAQPLAAALNGAAFLGIDVDAARIKQSIRSGACDYCVNSLDEALRILKVAVRQKQGISVGLIGNCAEIIPELARRGVVPDLLTDQTPGGDLLNGYIPLGLNPEQAARLRSSEPEEYLRRSRESIWLHAGGMASLRKLGATTFEYCNGLCASARRCGGAQIQFPSVEDYLAAAISAGQAPLRWFALSGDQADISRVDDLALSLFPEDALLSRWIHSARRVKFGGLPARAAWIKQDQHEQFALRLNQLVAESALKAPVVIGRDQVEIRQFQLGAGDHAASGAKRAAPCGRDLLDEALSTASGADWVSIDTRGSDAPFESAQAVVADGTPEAKTRIAGAFGGAARKAE